MAKQPRRHKWRLEQADEAEQRRRLHITHVREKGITYTDPADRNSRTYSYILGLYFRDMGKFPMLDEHDFRELDRQLLDGQRTEAQERLVKHTLRYAISVAHRYCNRGLPFLDLIQAANCGLMVASKRYDPSLGNYFLTYADWWIRSEIFSDLDAYARQVRMPRHPYHYRVLRAIERLTNELGVEPSVEEIASCLALPLNDVRRCWFKIKTGREMPLMGKTSASDDDDRTLQDRVASRAELRPDQYVEAREELEQAVAAIRWFFDFVWSRFGDHTHRILYLRYGLDGTGRAKTLEETGDTVGLTREAIRVHVLRFWERPEVRRTKKDHAWLKGRIDAITILQDLLGEELPSLDVCRNGQDKQKKKWKRLTRESAKS